MDKAQAAIFYFLLGILAVLPFGVGIYSWAWGYFALLSLLLFTFWTTIQAFRGARLPGAVRDYRWMLWSAVAVLTYQALKAVPVWPLRLVQLLSPETAEIYAFADIGIPRSIFSLSLDAGLAMREVVRVAAYFAVFFMILAMVKTKHQASQLANLLLTVVFVVGLWGLLDFFWSQLGRGRAAGLFGNANYFAGFLELGLGLAAGLLFVQEGHAGRTAWRTRLVGIIDWVMSWRAKLVLVFVVLLGGLFASGSRGGALAFLAALLISVLLMSKGQRSGLHARRFILWLGLISVTSITWLGADALMSRVGPGQMDQAARLSYWASGMRMVEDFPLFGMGGGSWRYAYALYRDPELPAAALPLHAHNDHVQMLTEHGVIGYTLMGLFVGSALFLLVKALRKRRDRFVKGIVFGALVSTLSLLFHAFTDNNFQVTPTMAYFFAILSLGLAAARLPSAGRSGSDGTSRRHSGAD